MPTEKVMYTPRLREQLELIRKNSAQLTKEEPEKSLAQFLSEIDFTRNLLAEIQHSTNTESEKFEEISEGDKVIISANLQEALIRFMEYHPAKRFNRNLRRMLLEHLMYDGATESIYLFETLMDLDGLFEFLDVMEEEWPPNSRTNT